MLVFRLRSDFHNFTKNGNTSFRRCSEKSVFPFFVKFENHLARPKTAHFLMYPFAAGLSMKRSIAIKLHDILRALFLR